jgi:hypothetical protein
LCISDGYNQLTLSFKKKAQLKAFVKLVDHLKLLPEDEKKLFAKRGRFPFSDAGKRREAKIKQAQKEIELKQKVQVCIIYFIL